MLNESGDLGQIYNRNVSIFNGVVDGLLADLYRTVFRCNRIEEVVGDFDFSPAEEARVIAELQTLRALSHFEIVKLWAQPAGYTANNSHPGIIYRTETSVTVLPRPSVAETYNNILADLTAAVNSNALSVNNPYAISAGAAEALLAKVYFQLGDYSNALLHADNVINSGAYRLDTTIDRFQTDTANLSEIIFKTRSFVTSTINDPRSGDFTGNYRTDLPQPPFLRASADFYEDYAEDTLDSRVTELFEVINADTPDEFVGVKKFNKPYFDVPILHLTDLKLLRAECLTLLNQDLNTATQDVNDIRERAYGNSSANVPAGVPANALLEEVRKERRIEMFGEGDRVQQLKRRGAFEDDQLMIRDVIWNCDGMILQFPGVERTELFDINPQGGC